GVGVPRLAAVAPARSGGQRRRAHGHPTGPDRDRSGIAGCGGGTSAPGRWWGMGHRRVRSGAPGAARTHGAPVTVYLVGAGPGDPGLLTRRGAKLVSQADVVIFDRLVHRSLLALAPSSAALVDVGKRPDAGQSGTARQA